ncbi:MAG: hypothetical protein U0166_22665 [Acidobacteriota bacterium]
MLRAPAIAIVIRRFPLALMVVAAASAHVWTPGPTAPGGLTARSTTMTYDAARGQVVLFGGTDGTLYRDTWLYDGTAWTLGPNAPAGLTARRAHALAFDNARARVVLFGGNDGALRNDTWLFDGTSWSAGPVAPAPLLPRAESAMAFDIPRGRMVLFGGDNSMTGTALLDDTWEYDGASWTAGPAAPAGLTARTAHALAFDQRDARTVLFGGFDGALRNDTWLYDGTSWTAGPAAPAGLVGRNGHAMAWESTPERIVIFGGFISSGYVSQTWELDGTTWTPGAIAPANLEARFQPGCAYDSARGVAIVFGGFDGAAPYFRDTWEYTVTAHYLVGAGLGAPNENRVRMFESDGNGPTIDFLANGAGSYGTNVAARTLDSGSNEEIVTGPGPGAVLGPQVRGFRSDATAIAKINYFAYGTLKFGVNAGAERLDADAFGEILTGAGPGDVFGPHVRGWNFDGAAIQAIGKVSYFAYGTLKFGVNVEGGDVEGDGFDEILTAPGPGSMFGPQVRGWNVDGGAVSAMTKINFNAFGAPQYGANVAGGFVDLDGWAEIVAAPGPGPALPSRFLGFDYDASAIAAAPGFDVTPFATAYGGRVGLGGVASKIKADLIACPGRDPVASSSVQGFTYSGTALTPIPGTFTAFPALSYGANGTAHSGGE